MTEEKESGSADPGVIGPTRVPRNITAGAPVQPVRLRDCSLDADADRQGSLGGYVKFDRMEDEGKFGRSKCFGDAFIVMVPSGSAGPE